MFERIVSKLSLSPSAVSELTYYSRRLNRERTTRGFSAFAAVLIVILQLAVVFAPAAPVNAASPNDLIYGGFVNKNDLLNRYDSSAELKALYTYFGITRQDIAGASDVWINSRDHNDGLNSIGRLQYFPSDDPIKVGKYSYWGRPLHIWDTGANVAQGSNYEVLQGVSATSHRYFAIMFRCGNIVYKTMPTTPKPTPPPLTPIPTPKPTPTPPPTSTPAKPTVDCVDLIGNTQLGSITAEAPITVRYTAIGSASGQSIADYIFDFGDGTGSTQAVQYATHTYTKVGHFIAKLKIKGSTGTQSTTPPACTFTVNTTPTPAAFTKHKTALNLTQNIDAATAPARPGDQIRYNLTTTNVGGLSSTYTVVEHLEDVLQYANVTDTGDGVLQNGVMTWPQTTIAPGQTLTESFTVTVKNPVPTTPVGLSDPASYDLHMDNVYGNQISVAVQPPLPKQIETASASLPDTGAPTATLIVLIVSGLCVYFYLRNRQLATEIKLLRGEFQGGV